MTDTAELASHARTTLWEIRDLYNQLPQTIATNSGLHAINYNRHGAPTTADTTILGGDALVMYAHGNTQTTIRNTPGQPIDWHLAQTETRDAPSVTATLTKWEDTWRHHQNHPAATHTTLNHTITYLATHTTWAITNFPDITTYLEEINHLRARLRAVTGHTTPPKPSDAPCTHCNGRIVQRYHHGPTPETRGLDDTRECQRCGTTYTPTQYAQAIQTRLQALRDHPDKLLTATEARTLWDLSPKQIYTWEYRGKLTPTTHDTQGRKLYRNADIATLKGRPQPPDRPQPTERVYSERCRQSCPDTGATP